MIKIYLDSNVYQALKKPENARLLTSVLESKTYTCYCFSEAHLFDLNQDLQDYKYSDMDHIETIANANCYYYTDRTHFSYRTPKEYYDDFDWSTTHDLGFMEGFNDIFESLIRMIPLPLEQMIKPEDLPAGTPENMKRLLTSPTNMWDFMQGILSLYQELRDQKAFREHLEYLHNINLLQKSYESIGIEGFDGIAVTDRQKFWASYSKKFIPESGEKKPYDLYIEMFHGLDIFGIVKGKPKKQKMMSLLNDGRHAYFGRFCDIVVTNDSDFINKATFMYKLENIGTSIVHFSEFGTTLDQLKRESTNPAGDLLEELNRDKSYYQVYFTKENTGGETGDSKEEYVKMEKRYFLYFDLMGYCNDLFGSMQLVIKDISNLESGVLTSQIRYVAERLYNAWGPDLNGKCILKDDEIINNVFLRTWRVNDQYIYLIMSDLLYLAIYPLSYLQAQVEAGKIQEQHV